jgi:hypothetical protein
MKTIANDQQMAQLRALSRLYYGERQIRAHGAAQGAENTIFRSGLKNREIPLGIDGLRYFQHILGAYTHTQPAAFAQFAIQLVLKRHG